MAKNNFKIRIIVLFIITSLVIFIFNTYKVKADMGPKPYLEITLKNMESKEYYVTLISEDSDFGPHVHPDLYSEITDDMKGEYPLIWDKFYNYVDEDNYYFLNLYRKFEGDCKYRWGYYPPHKFKLLIYFPSTDSFIVSKKYQTYAFSSEFEFDLKKAKGLNEDISTISTPIELKKEAVVINEIFKFLFRVSITVGIEIFIAFLFFWRIKPREFSIIILVNVVTQIGLNIVLSIWTYHYGFGWIEIPFYVMIEFMIFVVEGIAYHYLLKRELEERDRRWIPFVYSFVANFVTCIIGYFLVVFTTYYI